MVKKIKKVLTRDFKRPKDFFSKITKAIAGKSKVDDEVLDSLEEALVGADVGIETTVKIIECIEKRVAKDKYLNTTELNRILQEEIESILTDTSVQNNYADLIQLCQLNLTLY